MYFSPLVFQQGSSDYEYIPTSEKIKLLYRESFFPIVSVNFLCSLRPLTFLVSRPELSAIFAYIVPWSRDLETKFWPKRPPPLSPLLQRLPPSSRMIVVLLLRMNVQHFVYSSS